MNTYYYISTNGQVKEIQGNVIKETEYTVTIKEYDTQGIFEISKGIIIAADYIRKMDN